MKQDIHPTYTEKKVVCSGCGNTFVTSSTIAKDIISIDVCNECHPFCTGQQKIVDTAGRVDRFDKKYRRGEATPSSSTAQDTSA